MDFQKIISEIQDVLGFENLTLDENDTITLSVDNLYATLASKDNYVYIVTTLCEVPENPSELYALALAHNDMGKLGVHIGVLNHNNSLIMTTKISLMGLSTRYLLKRLNNHFESSKILLQEMANLENAE